MRACAVLLQGDVGVSRLNGCRNGRVLVVLVVPQWMGSLGSSCTVGGAWPSYLLLAVPAGDNMYVLYSGHISLVMVSFARLTNQWLCIHVV